MSGLSANEAKAFHRFFMMGIIAYVVIAIIAHFLVWQWRPWFPGVDGYASLTDSVNAISNFVFTRFT
ncbi:MAG: light-harvesting antenna LH1, beta subunit [Pseudomonadota bacterium]